MRKGLAWLLAFLMILSAGAALAEAPAAAPETDAQTAPAVALEIDAQTTPTAAPETGAQIAPGAVALDRLTVGSTTAMSGNFFTDMWGSNTADMDVRTLLHGYNLVQWNAETGAYGIDDTVVSGTVVTEDQAGNRTYTLALYDDMTYSDGTPITARDYVFSLLFSIAPQVQEIGGAINGANHILGIEAYQSGESAALAGVRLLGDYQLAITVKAEYLPFFYELALLSITPYPIQVIAPGCEVADDGEGAYIRNIDETIEEPIFTAELLRETVLNPETGYLTYPSVTSGPYKLVAYDPEAHAAEFEINEAYKGNSAGQKPQIAHLTFRVTDNADMISKLESGEFGLLNKCVNAETLDVGMQLVTAESASASNYARTGYSFISFNCERPAIQSVRLRQAIASCFDKDAFITEYVRNYGLRVDSYYGIGQWMYTLVEGSVEPPVEAPAADADEAALAAYEAELAEWDALNLDALHIYNLDLEEAQRLLVEDGWTLNREGEEFDPEKDDVRCKEIDGELVALDLKLIYPEGNAVGAALESNFVENLAKVGVKLAVEAKPFEELLRIYYRQDARDCDMIYLATNFSSVFEPSATFNPEDAYQGTDNRSGIADAELYQLAVDMRQTEPGDVLGYCKKWVAFEEAWAEVLPAIPVYSNVYFDFYTPMLRDYSASASTSWAEAIVGAYLSDEVVEEVPVVEEEEEAEFID